jgi:hypothetical protein
VPVPSYWHEVGAQQEVSASPAHSVPCGLQVDTTQWSTPSESGTHGAPPQHWSRNWQTFVVVTFAGSAAAMQQLGSFAS